MLWNKIRTLKLTSEETANAHVKRTRLQYSNAILRLMAPLIIKTDLAMPIHSIYWSLIDLLGVFPDLCRSFTVISACYLSHTVNEQLRAPAPSPPEACDVARSLIIRHAPASRSLCLIPERGESGGDEASYLACRSLF